jgi:hypothetical protein
MKTYLLIFLNIIIFNTLAVPHKELPHQTTDFTIPDKYKSLIKNYPLSWKRLSGFEYSALHWEQFVLVYTKDNKDTYVSNHLEFMRVYEEDLDPEEDEVNYETYPVGTVLLKESFLNVESRPGKSLLLSGMIKRKKGYDSSYGDWEYFQSSPDGKLLFSGNSTNAPVMKTCIECHGNISEKDFVFASHYSISLN